MAALPDWPPVAESSSFQWIGTMVSWGGVTTWHPQSHSNLHLVSWLDPDQNVAENPRPVLQNAKWKTLLIRACLGSPPLTKASPACSRMLSPFWRIDACVAFVFSGLRSGWASGHQLPSRSFLQGEILTFLHEHSKCLWVEQWLQQLFFRWRLGFVLTLRRVNCCVHGASRWAVKERRLGGVGALDYAIFAFSGVSVALGPAV